MAYTDYVNVAAPDNWDEPASGIVDAADVYGGAGATLAGLQATRINTLADIWIGTEYDMLNLAYNKIPLFVLPVAQPINWLAVDHSNYYETIVPIMWDEAGVRIEGTLDIDSIQEATPTPPPEFSRYVNTWALSYPVTVKAFAFIGRNGYPQGIPFHIYGVYGTLLAGDPPPPDPFWTNFIKTSEISA